MSDLVSKKTVEEIVEEINQIDIDTIELDAKNQEFFKTVQAYQHCYDELEALYNKIDPTGKLAKYEMDNIKLLIQQVSGTGKPVQNIEELYEVANIMSPVFEDKIHSLLDQLTSSSSTEEVSGVKFKLPPGPSKLKGKERAFEKARDDYVNNVPGPPISWLNDIVRGSLLFQTVEQLFQFVELLLAEKSIVVVKSKNRFHNPTLSGYRDFNLQIQISNNDDGDMIRKHICELQLHISAIKEAAIMLDSHSYYEFFRKFYAGATDSLKERMDDLRAITKGGSLDKAFLTNVVQNPVEVDRMMRLADLFEKYMNEYQLAIVITNAMKESLEPDDFYLRMGGLLKNQGKLEEALTLYKKALDIRLEALGPNHTDVAMAYNNMANGLQDHGHLEKAMELYKNALEIYVEELGPEDKNVANCYNNMALVLRSQGNLKEAMELYRKSVEIKLKTLGPHHTSVAQTYNNMGNILRSQGQYEGAMKMYQKANEIRVRALGPNHTNVAESYNNMAVVLEKQGNLDEALAQHQEALQIYLKALGPDHSRVAMSYNNMALVLCKQGKLEEALMRYQEALEIKLKSFGPEHISVAASYNNMGMVLKKQGKLENAMALFRKALDIHMKALGPEHVNVAASYTNMAVVLRDQGKLEEATAECNKALEIRLKSHGPDHIATKKCYRLIAIIQNQLDNR